MSSIPSDEVKAGYALYTKFFLSNMYDWLFINQILPRVYGCQNRDILELYNEHVSANHLDVGVGTGYFLDHCRFPTINPRVGLMDLNPNSLEISSRRLQRYSPETYLRNVLEPIHIDTPKFDSVGLFNLLPCLPGNMKSKKVVFEHLKSCLNPGGVVFGSTILYKGIKRGALAALFMDFANRRRIISNREDDLEGLNSALNELFAKSSIKLVGCIALFWAR